MIKLESMGLKEANELHAEMQKVLLTLEQKYNIKFKFGNFRYDPFLRVLRPKIQASIVIEEVEVSSDVPAKYTVADRQMEIFRERAELYGLKASDLKRSFVHKSKMYTIIGMKAERVENNILITRADNKRNYVCSAENIKTWIAA
jgi:hypothetical protein